MTIKMDIKKTLTTAVAGATLTLGAAAAALEQDQLRGVIEEVDTVDRELTLDVAEGTPVDIETYAVEQDARIIRDGRSVALADLEVGEKVRIDLEEDVRVAATTQTEPRPVVVRYVTVEQPIILAQADTSERRELPQTASLTPFVLALGGGLGLGALVLRARRKAA